MCFPGRQGLYFPIVRQGGREINRDFDKMRISGPYFSKPDLSEQQEKKYNTDTPEGKTGERCLKGMTEHDGEVPEE